MEVWPRSNSVDVDKMSDESNDDEYSVEENNIPTKNPLETPIHVPVIPNPVTDDSASVTATIASCTHTASVSKTDVTIVPASTTHSATTEDTHIIPTASISFNSTPTCTATTTMPSNDAKHPRLADKLDEIAISLGLTMPPVVKRRGRPKGHTLTVCGLPSKKNKKKAKCTSFISKHYTEKEKIVLSWFVESDIIDKAMDGELIEEESVECQPERVSSAVLDDNVDINLVRCFFSHDAWLVVEDVVQRKKDFDLWICNVCQHELDGDNIICESCLEWFHYGCVGVVSKPKSKNWFCRKCCASM